MAEIDISAVVHALTQGAAHVGGKASPHEHGILTALARDIASGRVVLERVTPPEDERIFALRELTTSSEAWADLDMSDTVRMIREGLAAYDELKASLPAGDRKVTEEWGVRTRSGILHTQDVGNYKITSREDAEGAGFNKQTNPEPVLLRRVTTFTEKIGDER